MTAPEPPNDTEIVEVVRTWRTSTGLRLAQGWPLALRLAQRLDPDFDAPAQDPPKWDKNVDWGIGGYRDELETHTGPRGWKVSCSESFSGPAETFCQWDWDVSAKGLPAAWTLELSATGDNTNPGGECILKVKGPSAAVETVLTEAQAAMHPLQ